PERGSLPCTYPGSMEEEAAVLSPRANSTECSMGANWTSSPVCWLQVSGGGPEVVIVPVLFGLIFLLGMVGNTLVLVVLGRIRSGGRPSRSATNIFILNLSIADFSFLLFCIPFQATIYSLPEWVFGAFFCKWVHYLAMATMLVSIFTLVAMSVDRYIAVVHAKRSPCIRSKRNASLGVGIIWLLSLLIAIPVAQHQALMSGHHQAPNSSFCWEQWADDSAAKQTYKVAILVVGYLLPLVLITCCYAKVSERRGGGGEWQSYKGFQNCQFPLLLTPRLRINPSTPYSRQMEITPTSPCSFPKLRIPIPHQVWRG
uniref:G-protein coupled receptors family 1 profile domain-containing protein n=1 Tax=Gopherus agassizii TaxID=38772 RepID=A0A452GFJ8_9SAUR